ncbi:transport sec13 [Fusarium albosuccineum]|uniref:Transport sec13 n=1 Tax=Fusarium albosuccineum TaxID=1237068 RepID=A0A8H4LGZ7_9HYPO|nr:transport sec13 [Fusarium albosuccineum]
MMKLVIGGASGYLGTEVVRQALKHPGISSVVALGRRPTPIPEGSGSQAETSKFKSVTIDDFCNYSEQVKADIAGADGCIWLIAITPTRSKLMEWEEVRKICHDYAVTAADEFAKIPRDGKTEPLRFLYISGANAVRDPAKKPWILGDMCLMRGGVEAAVLERAQQSNGAMQACVYRPGLIIQADTSAVKRALWGASRSLISLPAIELHEMGAALLDQAVNGFSKDLVLNPELIEIGQKALEKGKEGKEGN